MLTCGEELMQLLCQPARSPVEIFCTVEKAAIELGFEYVAYGFRMPYPLTKPKIFVLDNFSSSHAMSSAETATRNGGDISGWIGASHRQQEVMHERANARDSGAGTLPDVQSDGCWTESYQEVSGANSHLTVSRSEGVISMDERHAKTKGMRWLVQVTHVSMSRCLMQQEAMSSSPLTRREREVMQWTADGKSAQDIADILKLSKRAVDFHLANSIKKLRGANKAAAVARAVMLGALR